MTQAPSPLSTAMPWDLVSTAYADEVQPQLAFFAEAALRACAVGSGTRVLDVAAGPGTLALRAAKRGARVTAIDISPKMIELLEEEAASEGLDIDARVGDGMELPFRDASFDAAFTMFGLMFYPDRDKAIRELRRVLRDGGQVGISTWAPMSRSPEFAAPFDVLRSVVPGLPPNDGKPPLGTTEEMRDALAAAGFRQMDAQEVVSTVEVPSPDALWAMMERTTAPVALMAKKIGPAWKELSAKVADGIRMRLGEGPVKLDLIGIVGVATR